MTKRGKEDGGEEKRESLQKWTDEAKRRRDEGGNEVDEERQPDFPRKYQVSRLEYRGAQARGDKKSLTRAYIEKRTTALGIGDLCDSREKQKDILLFAIRTRARRLDNEGGIRGSYNRNEAAGITDKRRHCQQ